MEIVIITLGSIFLALFLVLSLHKQRKVVTEADYPKLAAVTLSYLGAITLLPMWDYAIALTLSFIAMLVYRRVTTSPTFSYTEEELIANGEKWDRIENVRSVGLDLSLLMYGSYVFWALILSEVLRLVW